MKTLKVQVPGSSPKEGPKVVPVATTGGYLNVNLRDALKGLLIAAVIAAGSTVWEAVYAWVEHLPFNLDWQEVLRSAIKGGAAYVGINYFQGKKIIIKANDIPQPQS